MLRNELHEENNSRASFDVEEDAVESSDNHDHVANGVDKYERREYQIFLMQRAIEENIIICLPTGCGKTFIAAKVAHHFLIEASRKGQKIIFVTPTVPLAHQQGGYLQRHLGTKVVTITGEQKPQDWNGAKWKHILSEATVFTMTVKVLDDGISHALIQWKDISLLILDECHNAVGNHAMSTLMESYRKASFSINVKKEADAADSGEQLPRILGLSATIVIGNPKSHDQISEGIQLVQKKFCAKAMTYHDYSEVIKCSTSAVIETILYQPMASYPDTLIAFNMDMAELLKNIKRNIAEMENYFKLNYKPLPKLNHKTFRHCSQLFNNKKKGFSETFEKQLDVIEQVLREMGPFCAVNAILSKCALSQYIEFNERLSRQTPEKATSKELLCRYFNTQMDFILRHLGNYMSRYLPEEEGVLEFVTPKVKHLVEILRKNGSVKGDPICGIVFCKKRIIAQMLCYYIQDLSKLLPNEFGFLKCSFVLGTAGGVQNEAILKTALRKQSEVLNSFRCRELNIIVATNVLEEGLDVPSCNFILRFDAVETFPSYIQSMGRARQRGAKFYVLIPSDDAAKKRTNKLLSYSSMRSTLSEALIGNATLTEKFYDVNLEMDELELNKLIPPFQPTQGGAQITAATATQIVYQYCNGLSYDKLSALSPIPWWVKDIVDGITKYKVYVQLPPGACVKLEQSGWFVDRNVAKKDAFLKVCKSLYEAGVLFPDTLLPVPPHVLLNMSEFIEELEGCSSEIERNGKKIGSKGATKWYPKKIPQELSKKSGKFHVYAINFKMVAYFGHQENASLFNFEDKHICFGIVTHADLTTVPDFLIFSKDGNFRIHLDKIVVPHEGLDNAFRHRGSIFEQFELFQDLLFCKDPVLLGLYHPVLAAECNNSYYIAPLRKSDGTYEFAFDIITDLKNSQHVNYLKMLTIEERSVARFTPLQLSNALVVPCVAPPNSIKPKVFCVVSIQTDLSPISVFETKKNEIYESTDYVKYHKEKYGIDIIKKTGPMIRGKAIASHLHYLKSPFYENSTAKTKADSSSTLSLLPELMRIHPLPATLYIQLKMLPTCIHRITRLLLATEIQTSIAADCQISRDYNEAEKLEEELQKLNQDVIKASNKVVENVIPSDSDRKVPQHSHSNLKRKHWVEVEYIHPKNIKLEDLQNHTSDAEDNIELQNPTLTETHTNNYDLIQMHMVPSQNFDSNYSSETVQPLVTSLMEAMTLANARDFMSLEKLEMIGDSVLKLIVTLHIFFEFQNEGEGRLTALRTQLISNRHLCNAAAQKNRLGEYLSSSIFEPRLTWLPPGKIIPPHVTKMVVDNDTTYSHFDRLRNTTGEMLSPVVVTSVPESQLEVLIQDRMKMSEYAPQQVVPKNTTYTHSRIGDKSLADCVEALIGAYYMSGGINGALIFMEYVGLRGPTNETPARQTNYQKIGNLPNLKTNYPATEQSVILSSLVQELENMLCYKFVNKWLVVEALTHPSAIPNNGDMNMNSYQRLEFLGDAVLDFLVTHFIYQNEKMQTPGKLTDLRSALVNNVTFGSQSVRYGFHKLLRHFSQGLQTAINTFVECQTKNGHEVTGAFELLVENGIEVAEDIDVPKALGDILESLAGAIFIDSGNSLDTVWKIFYRLMKPEIDLFSENIPINPFRYLNERFPNQIKIKTMSEEGATRKVVELCIIGHGSFFGCGNTKKSAKEAAAKLIVSRMKINKSMHET